MRSQISKIIALIFVFVLVQSFSSSFLISDQGTDVKDIATGNLTAFANLTISIYDSSTGGDLIFEEDFTEGIVNGSWNFMINPDLEYGKDYWKDYKINNEDLTFDGEDRLRFQSSVGKLNNVSFVNFSLINSCPAGSSIRLIYEDGAVECETDDSGNGTSSNLANYALKNQSETFSGNITTSQTGFFGWLGSLASRITKLFVQDIDASGNVNVTGNVTASYFIGDGSLLIGINGTSSYNDAWINQTIYDKTQVNDINSSMKNYVDYVNSTNGAGGSGTDTFVANYSIFLNHATANYVDEQNTSQNNLINLNNNSMNNYILYVNSTNGAGGSGTDTFVANYSIFLNHATANYVDEQNTSQTNYINLNNDSTSNYISSNNQSVTNAINAVAAVGEPLWNANFTTFNESWSSTTNTSYIPYTGANQNVDLGNNNLTALYFTGSTIGSGLTLDAGRATVNGSNLNGGDLILKSGISTGSGSSAMHFYTTPLTTTAFPYNIGDVYGGGYVLYIFQPGDPGYDANVPRVLILNINALGRVYFGPDMTTGATGTALGTGLANTNAIVAAYGAGTYAASLARSYTGGGYNDWYLPSKDETAKIDLYRVAWGLNLEYWTSSEISATNAWLSSSSIEYNYEKNFLNGYVYAVRLENYSANPMADNTPVERMTILGSGNVGINTENPQRAFHVNGNILANGTINATTDVCIEGGNCLSGINSSSYIPYTGANQNVNLGNNVLTVGAGGSANIGNLLYINSTQAYKLYLNGETYVNGRLYTLTEVRTPAVLVDGNTNLDLGWAFNWGAGTAKTLNLVGQGRIGIADADGGDINIKGGMSTGNGSSNINFFTATPNVSGETGNTPTQKMIINGNGNVGINTENPQRAFHVNGNILANGTINATTDVCIEGGNCLSGINSSSYIPYTGANKNVDLGNNNLTTLSVAGSTVGSGLTLDAGRATVNGSNLNGGDLILKSGISTGSGSSAMHFYTTASDVSDFPYSIGDSYGGGTLAYILQPGDPGYDEGKIKGLIVSTLLSQYVMWWNGSYVTTGATGTAIGTGLSNTDTIIAAQGGTPTSYAAGLARAYNGGGFSDWYLPSKDELEKLYLNRVILGMGTYYTWSSSESWPPATKAWQHQFSEADPVSEDKSNTFAVWAVRSFSIDMEGTEDNTPLERMAILGNGNVGINTTNPFATLHVNGNILANGTINATTDVCIEGGNCLSGAATSGGANWNANYSTFLTHTTTNYVDEQNASQTNYINSNNVSVANAINAIASQWNATNDSYIPYTGANQNVDLGNNNLTALSVTGSTIGSGLTLIAGRATVNGSNLNGGDLILKSGISTGSGSSAMHFYTTSGTVYETVEIGDSYGGGKVFYILQPGDAGYDAGKQKGFIVSSSDIGPIASGTYSVWDTATMGPWGEESLGTGFSDTNKIIAVEGLGISYAARSARACTDGEFSDWYLPSDAELTKLYDNRVAAGVPSVKSYLTATEYLSNTNYVFYISFYDATHTINTKLDDSMYARAIRSFEISLTGAADDNTPIERLTILENGNVGISTISPFQKLHVNGNILANGTINATTDVCIEGGNCLSNVSSGTIYNDTWINQTLIPYTGANQNVNLGANNLSVNTNTLFVNKDNGRVGIGTASPSYALDVNGSIKVGGAVIYGDTPTPHIVLDTSTGSYLYYGNSYIWVGNSALLFAGGDVAGGIVGSPTYWRLTDSSGVGNELRWSQLGLSTGAYQGFDPAAAIHIDKGNAVASSLKLTAGTTTGRTSTDGFDIGIDSSGNGNIWQYENLSIIIGTNNSEVARITDNGSVGIGTTNPLQSLHVNGNILANGTINSSVDVCIEGGNCLSGTFNSINATTNFTAPLDNFPACSVALMANVRYNTTSNKLMYCNTTDWVEI